MHARPLCSLAAPLSAYIEPPLQTIDVGSEAIFNCTVYGHPVSGVQWYRDGRPLDLDDRVTLESEQVLRITQVQREDRGMYQCLIRNDRENAQAAAQLAIGGKYSNHLCRAQIYVYVHNVVRL